MLRLRDLKPRYRSNKGDLLRHLVIVTERRKEKAQREKDDEYHERTRSATGH